MLLLSRTVVYWKCTSVWGGVSVVIYWNGCLAYWVLLLDGSSFFKNIMICIEPSMCFTYKKTDPFLNSSQFKIWCKRDNIKGGTFFSVLNVAVQWPVKYTFIPLSSVIKTTFNFMYPLRECVECSSVCAFSIIIFLQPHGFHLCIYICIYTPRHPQGALGS